MLHFGIGCVGKSESFKENRSYTLTDGVVELVAPSMDEKTYYKVLDNALIVSDKEGTINKSEGAEDYQLKKQ